MTLVVVFVTGIVFGSILTVVGIVLMAECINEKEN